MAWGSNPVTPPASVGVDTAGGWSGTPTVKAPIIGAGWVNFKKEYPLSLSGSGALSATLLAKPKVLISFSGAGNLVPGKTQKYTRAIVFGNEDRSGTGLISGFSAWTYSKRPYPVSFSGSGQIVGVFPEFDGFRAVVDRSYYPRDMPEVSVGTFAPTVYQKYSVPVAFTGTGNSLHLVIGDNDGLKGILGAAYAYLETSTGTLAANAYALFGIPFVNDGNGTLSFSARMYLLNIAAAFNSMGTLSAVTIARRLTNYVQTSDGLLSATAVGQMVRSVVLSGNGSFSSLARMYSFNQAVSLSGAGNISATTLMKMFINASESGEGTFSATTLMQMLRAAALSGDGALSPAARLYLLNISSALSGSGTVSATTLMQMLRSVPLSSDGALTSLARMYSFNQAVGYSGNGTVSATTLMQMVRAAALSGDGTLSSSARIGLVNILFSEISDGTVSATTLMRMLRTAALSGDGAVSATTLMRMLTNYTATGSGLLSAAVIAQMVCSAALSGSGALTPAARMYLFNQTVALSGSGTVSAFAIMQMVCAAALSGDGTLSSLARIGLINFSTALSASGSLSATRSQIYTNTYGMVSSGSLSATRTEVYQRAFALSGAGSAGGTAVAVRLFTGALAGAGSITATSTQKYAIAVNFSGAGTVSALADFPVTAAVTTSLTTTGEVSTTIPYWCKKLDVVVLGGGGGGQGGGAGFNNGKAGAAASYNAGLTLTRGVDFPWNKTTFRAFVGNAGTGGTGGSGQAGWDSALGVEYGAVGAGASGSGSSGTGSVTLSWTHTPYGYDNYVIVSLAVYATGQGGFSTHTRTATYGGTAMTFLGAVNANNATNGWVESYGIAITPGASAQTVSVTVSKAGTPYTSVKASSVSYGNVNAATVSAVTTFGSTATSQSGIAYAFGGTLVGAAVGLASTVSGISTLYTQAQRFINNTSPSFIMFDSLGAAAELSFAAATAWGHVAVLLPPRTTVVGTGGAANAITWVSGGSGGSPGNKVFNSQTYVGGIGSLNTGLGAQPAAATAPGAGGGGSGGFLLGLTANGGAGSRGQVWIRQYQ